jgi:hypothetical protein
MLELAKMFGGSFTFNTESDTIGLESNIANIEDAKRYLSFESVHKVENYVKTINNFSLDELTELGL